jgi:beta-phosphoglucomutase
MTTNIKAVLFDLDGVLVDTRKLHYLALSLALQELGFELSHEEHELHYDGLPTYTKVAMLTERFQFTPEQVLTLNLRKQKHTIELLQGKILPTQEQFNIFSYLKEKNIKMAICSNTKRSTLNHIIKNLNISQFLAFSLSNEDVQEPKPSPEIYLTAMSMLGVTAEETLVFEDSPHGLESARNSLARVEQVENSDNLTLERIKKIIS